ncbi:MAG: ATP-binding protein [Pseudomonadota bacterium]
MKRLSFHINSTIWMVCVIILLVFGIFFYGQENRQRQRQIDQVGLLMKTVYQQKREELANEIFSGHREALKRSLYDMASVKGIVAVTVFTTDGRMLETWGLVGPGTLSPVQRRQLEREPLTAMADIQDRPTLVFSSVIEVIGEHMGYAAIYFDLSEIYQASQQRLLLIVGVFASMLVALSALLHLLITRLVARPVSCIRDAMRQVMDGRLGEQVSLQQGDEIGEVGAAFNAMSTQLSEQHQRLLRSMSARDANARQLEETNRELARLNADLESIVDERTRELRTSYEQLQEEIVERQRADSEKRMLEERLSRSQKMEALGLLAGGVAHDLNNVLSGIVSYPELILLDLPEDALIRPMVTGIQNSGKKAAAIVQDLLALARRGVHSSAVLNLNDDVISDYLASPECHTLRAHHPGVAINAHLASDLMNISGSIIHLKKTVMNIVSNAAEAQPEGGRIVITTENRYVDRPIKGYAEVAEGDYVVLRVEDFGSGIRPEDLDRIFEPFYTKKVMGRSGTGLGMAVVWGTVQDHNGYINVDSHLGQGTRLEIYLPVSREPLQLAAAAVPMDAYRGSGETVLVVDDVAEQRDIAKLLLSRLNYQVTTIGSGEAALVWLKDNRADVLVLDMIMDPGMDGLDTYRAIVARGPHQRAVIASGFAENDRVKEAQRLGAGAYIRKPYSLEKIGLAIREALSRPMISSQL